MGALAKRAGVAGGHTHDLADGFEGKILIIAEFEDLLVAGF